MTDPGRYKRPLRWSLLDAAVQNFMDIHAAVRYQYSSWEFSRSHLPGCNRNHGLKIDEGPAGLSRRLLQWLTTV